AAVARRPGGTARAATPAQPGAVSGPDQTGSTEILKQERQAQTRPPRGVFVEGKMIFNPWQRSPPMDFPTIESCVGNTPLVRLQRIGAVRGNSILVKLEGNNPAGSVKDRPALSMIQCAEARGEIKPGDTLIEATSGNTGIALAMVAAVKGYRMVLIMPDHMTEERKAAMAAYGAELILVSKEEGMEGARDLALQMRAEGRGIVLDQFNNPDNPRAHRETTGPEIWRQTAGTGLHFVSAVGSTGPLTGVSQYLNVVDPAAQLVGLRPAAS